MFKLMRLYKRSAVQFKTSKITFVLFCRINGTLIAKMVESLNRKSDVRCNGFAI